MSRFRSRQSRALLVALVVIVTGIGAFSTSVQASTGSPEPTAACDVTPYRTDEPDDRTTKGTNDKGEEISFTQTWYGNDALWAGLSPATAGRWYAGETGNKVLWYREIAGELSITGRRLDGDAPPLTVEIPDGYGYGQGIQASELIFPTSGCWEVTGRIADRELRFTILVLGQESNPLINGGQESVFGPETWLALRRPLPTMTSETGASCPAATNTNASSEFHTAGAGPIYAAGAAGDGLFAFNLGDPIEGRGVAKGWWAADPSYTGPVLIRGRQIDGDEQLRIRQDGSNVLVGELHLTGSGDRVTTDGWRVWGLETYLRQPGCYAVQIDGWNFSETIVLRAIR